jgi:archaemetzincin
MGLENITLISFGYFDQEILERISPDISREFSFPVTTKSGNLDLSGFYDPSRRQYNGTALLNKINSDFASDSSKTLGLFTIDLFIPILTYIFGQAVLNGRIGIASTYRLNNERYGIKTDSMVVLERFRKEAIHELGHMFGLLHCSDPVCVMRSSTYVEDIDQKGLAMCHSCRTRFAQYRVKPEN